MFLMDNIRDGSVSRQDSASEDGSEGGRTISAHPSSSKLDGRSTKSTVAMNKIR
jgi:hypothetical protein